MTNKGYTKRISRLEYDHNVSLLLKYKQDHQLANADLLRLTGLTNTNLHNIITGRYEGTVRTWMAIKETLGLDIRYTILEERYKSKQQAYIEDYIIPHLNIYGNVYVNPKRFKSKGAKEELVNVLLENYGLHCSLEIIKESKDCICKLEKGDDRND